MQYRSFLFLAAVSAFAVTACSKESTEPTTGTTANVRIVNASSGNATINAMSGSTALASNLAYQNVGAASSCSTVPAGNQTINFTNASGASVGSASYNFQAGQNYTVLLYGGMNGTSPSTLVIPDQFTAPTTGNMAVRFINATGAAGDIYATAPGATVSGAPVVSNATTLSSSYTPTWTTVPSTNTMFTMYTAGSTVTAASTPIGTYTLSSVPTNGVSTVIFTPSLSASGPTAFAVNTCQ